MQLTVFFKLKVGYPLILSPVSVMNISDTSKPDATQASNQVCFWIQTPVPTSNQSCRDCINIYKHSILMPVSIVYQLWPGALRSAFQINTL